MTVTAPPSGSLKIIGAGFGRTGTLSLKAALEILGFAPCHHMVEVLSSAKQRKGWVRVADGDLAMLPQLMEGYQAQVDFPGCIFYPELMRLYPNARVILSVRDAESWWESARHTIYEISNGIPMRWMARFNPMAGPMLRVANRLIWERMFSGRFLDKPYALQVFRDYNEQVKRTVPPEKLLVYEVKQGWGPLCAFLGVPVPEVPFPKVNDTAEFQGRVRIIRALSWTFLTVAVALLLSLVWFLLGFFTG